MEIKAVEAQSLVDSGSPTLIVCVADWCPHCQELKKEFEPLQHLAAQYNINLEVIKVTEPENQEFLTKNPFETLPYCLVFVGKEFKGGENASAQMLMQLMPALAEAVARENIINAQATLNNPEFTTLNEQPS